MDNNNIFKVNQSVQNQHILEMIIFIREQNEALLISQSIINKKVTMIFDHLGIKPDNITLETDKHYQELMTVIENSYKISLKEVFDDLKAKVNFPEK